MFIPAYKLANEMPKDKPKNTVGNALQEGLGEQSGEMHTMIQYLFQNFKFIKETSYQNLIKSVAFEEIDYLQLISTASGTLLECSTHTTCPKIS